MINFIHDVINDPAEYLPAILFAGVLVVIWGGLCWSGVASVRAATKRRRVWFALAPLLFGGIGLWAQMPISMENDEFRLSFDFRWFFFVPLLLGIAGIASSWRLKNESVA
jgi:hypothetical protein